MTGRKQQARAGERRTAVLEATLRLLAREGPRAVTHRAVAREAGTSLRAATYYFASRDELLSEALVHYARTALARFDQVRVPDLAGAKDPVGLAASMLAGIVLSDLEADRVGLVAEYELVLEIGRSGALEGPYRAWQQRLESLLVGYAEQLGSADPPLVARIVLATLRGLELEALARPSQKPDAQGLTLAFRTLIEALVAREAARPRGAARPRPRR